MTLQALKDKWKDEIHNWDVKNLKADAEFMADSKNCEAFRDYVLLVKPGMASKPRHEVKFKRPAGIVADMPPEVEKPLTAKLEALPEEVEPPLSKTGQILKDLLGYKKNKGFL